MRNNSIYLPRVGGDFQGDLINVQLSIIDNKNYIFQLENSWQTVPAKEGVMIQYDAARQMLNIPFVMLSDGQFCRNVGLKVINTIPVQFQLTETPNSSCGHSLNSLLNNTQVNSVTPSAQAYLPNNQVYLLIHGMNSSPETWNRLLDYWRVQWVEQWVRLGYLPSDISDPALFSLVLTRDVICPIIEFNSSTQSAYVSSAPLEYDENWKLPSSAIQCYRIKFGTHFRYGLDGSTRWDKGDGATFGQLGKEVGTAVKLILERQPNAPITLVGHSRGGLAARAFLQTPSTERNAVKGLLTIGTPHLGSPLGRIYPWLAACTPSSGCDATGTVNSLKWLLDVIGVSLPPTIGDLSTGSEAIRTLNSAVQGRLAAHDSLWTNRIAAGRVCRCRR